MNRLIYCLLCLLLSPALLAQHAIVKTNGNVMNVKITEITDSTLTYQQGSKKNISTETISMREVESYKLQDGILFHVSQPAVIEPQHDTITSIVKDTIETALLLQYADKQNKAIAKALKTTGTVAMSIGVPCLAGGIASLVYAYLLPNPTNGYTTSQALASQNANLEYMSVNEYVAKLEEYNGKVKMLNNVGYLASGAGAALTIVGIPLYCYGNHLLKLKVNYTGNGAGLVLNF